MGYRDQSPPTTPECFRSEAQQTERGQRILESPECHRTPHHVQMARSGVSIAPIPPPVFVPLTIVPSPAPIYSNLDPCLAQQYAALPDLYPRRQPSISIAPVPMPQLAPAPGQYSNISDLAQRYAALPPLIYPRGRQPSVAPVPAPQLAPAFVPAPAPARYSNIPDLAQRYAALPPLIERGRGTGRGNPPLINHGRGRVNPPLSYTELAAQYAALPPVCFIFYFICEFG